VCSTVTLRNVTGREGGEDNSMRARTTAPLAWSLWLLVASGIAFGLSVRAGGDLQDVPFLVSFGAFATVGAVVASRRPENPVGWLFLAIGILTAIAVVGDAYAEQGLPRRGAIPPAVMLGAWIQTWFWYPLIAMSTLFSMLLFPSGLPSRRWRPVLWVSVVLVAVVTVMAAHSPTLEASGRRFSNPFRAGGLSVEHVEETRIFQLLTALILVGIGVSVVSLVLRFRRSRGVERQQLKWFVYAVTLVALTFLASALFPAYERSDASGFIFGFVIGLVPVSCGIAILRYRLYDIDRIINRTLVYLGVTSLLALIYIVCVFAFGGLVVGASDNILVVAATTLAAAGLFRPLRARVQSFVDSRFYRSRYDATRTLDDFGHRLREETDLDELTRDLVAVVRKTMQPKHVSVWLRPRTP
jgi:hypothetical protein